MNCFIFLHTFPGSSRYLHMTQTAHPTDSFKPHPYLLNLRDIWGQTRLSPSHQLVLESTIRDIPRSMCVHHLMISAVLSW